MCEIGDLTSPVGIASVWYFPPGEVEVEIRHAQTYHIGGFFFITDDYPEMLVNTQYTRWC